tara:strand:- start:2492 stop:3481 length:990 start_codon:yes stop_codon:yes gene_type:complete
MITEIKKDTDLEEKLLGRDGKVDEIKDIVIGEDRDAQKHIKQCMIWLEDDEMWEGKSDIYFVSGKTGNLDGSIINEFKFDVNYFNEVSAIVMDDQMLQSRAGLLLSRIINLQNLKSVNLNLLNVFNYGLFGTVSKKDANVRDVEIKGDIGDYWFNFAEVTAEVIGNVGVYLARECKNSSIQVKGNIGDGALYLANNVTLNAKNNVGSGLCEGARDCVVYVQGSTGKYVGTGSDNCEFYFHGPVGELNMTGATNCEFVFYDQVGDYVKSTQLNRVVYKLGIINDKKDCEDCVFKATDFETVMKLHYSIPRGNRIVYIDHWEDKIIRDFDG